MRGLLSLRRFWLAVRFRVDFTQPLWVADSRAARVWIGISSLAGLVALLAVGDLSVWTLILALLSPLGLWLLPARLAFAAAHLYTIQALASLALVAVLFPTPVPDLLIQLVAAFWQLWCMGALVVMILGYIRTPRAALAK